MSKVNISSDLEEAMFETGKSLSAISKFDSVLEKNQPIYMIVFHCTLDYGVLELASMIQILYICEFGVYII